MQPSQNIRRATSADTDSITTLVTQAYTPYIARIGKKPAPMLDDYRQVIADDEVFVLTHDAVIAGVLVVSQEDSTLLLVNIAVLPRYKGQGIGKQLMRFCEEHAHQAQCTAIRLYTHELMTENIAIYQKLGFEETHRATENGFARVFMRKAI